MLESQILNQRLTRLRKLLVKNNINTLVVTNAFNILYLTGFIGLSPNERESVCIVDQKNITLIVSRLYEESVKKYALSNIHVEVTKERDEIFTFINEHIHGSNNIAVEANNITLREYNILIKILPYKIIGSENIIEKLRGVKDKSEINIIRKAVQITDTAFMKISREIIIGITEIQIANKLTEIMESLGADAPSFEPIVASGKSSSLPHHKTSNKPIDHGILLIDAGARYKGYNADLTRTFFIGNPDPLFIKRYNLVLKAQSGVIDTIKPGITEQEVFLTTKRYLGNESQYFTHGTGHGVGLEIHEVPYLRHGRLNKIESGMTVTVEPGLYYPEWGGIRIEDYILITDGGCTVLSEMKRNIKDMLINT